MDQNWNRQSDSALLTKGLNSGVTKNLPSMAELSWTDLIPRSPTSLSNSMMAPGCTDRTSATGIKRPLLSYAIFDISSSKVLVR